jgi:multiple sugar transport system substrate-binding protein/sn-glycerol 3-phosphate transport system substrate-binding protein
MTSPAYQMAYEILGHGVYEPPVPGYHEVRDQYQDAFRSIIESADVQDALGQLSAEANLFLNEQMALIPELPDPWGEIDPSGQTITLWHQHPEDRRAAFEKIINEFNITNKWGITVIPENQESYGDIFLNLLPVIGTEGAPDLVLAYQHHAAAYHLANALIDLNSLVESTTWGINSLEREDFFPGIYSQDIFPIFDGARLGYPVQRSMDVLYYNADWLADLGFDSPPATPEEFIQMACAAAAPNQPDKENTLGYQIYVDATRFSSWVFAFGGEIFDEGANSFNYDNPLTAEVVNYFLDLINTGCAAAVFERQEAHTAFTDEVSLFLVDSSIHIPTIDSQIKENADFDWAIAPMPSSQEDPIQHVFGASLSILPSNPEKELAAWLFLKHFTSPEIQAEWGKTSNFLPVRISSAEHLEDYFSDHPQYHKAFELLTFGITEPSLPGYDFVGQEVDIALETILQGADVNEVLTSLNQIANQLLTMHLER